MQSQRPEWVIHPLVLAAGSAALLGALGYWPYGYYQFLRLVICAITSFFAYAHFKAGRQVVGSVSAAIALLFNPIAPVELDRDEWHVIDVVVAFAIWVLGVQNLREIKGALCSWLGRWKDRVFSIVLNPNYQKIAIGILIVVISLGIVAKQAHDKREAELLREAQERRAEYERLAEERRQQERKNPEVLNNAEAISWAIRSLPTSRLWSPDGKYWTALNLPGDLQGLSKFSYRFDSETLKSFELDPDPTGLPRRLIIQAALPNSKSYDCRGCGAIISMYAMKAEFGRVSVEAFEPYVGLLGEWGAAPEPEVFEMHQLGPSAHVLTVKQGSMAQGIVSERLVLIGYIAGRFVALGQLGVSESHAGCDPTSDEGVPCFDYDSTISFKDGSGPLKDIFVTTKGTTLNKNLKAVSANKTVRYRIDLDAKQHLVEISSKEGA